MHFSLSAATAAMVMATSALAQDIQPTVDFDPVSSPELNKVVPTGQGFAITWSPISKYNDVKVMIELIGGEYQNGQTHRAWVTPEGTTIDNKAGTYTWNVGSEHGTLPCYGLKIISADKKLLQYSPPFFIGSKKHCPKTLGEASSAVVSSSASSSASPATTASAATGYPAVSSAVAPKATGAGVPAPKASVICNNATGIAKAGTPGASGAGVVGAAAPAGAGAAAGAARPSTGLVATPNNTTGSPVTVKNGAPMVQAGFLSVFGAVAVALAL